MSASHGLTCQSPPHGSGIGDRLNEATWVSQRNELAEAVVKKFKRDYVDGAELPDAEAVLAPLSGWIDDYNTRAPHSPLGSPAEYRAKATLNSSRGAVLWGALHRRDITSQTRTRNAAGADVTGGSFHGRASLVAIVRRPNYKSRTG